MKTRLWNNQTITSKLTELDCKNISETVRDVTEIVEMRIFASIFDKLSDDLKNTLKEKNELEITEYFKAHPEVVPALTKEEIFDIEDKTWSDYFIAVKK